MERLEIAATRSTPEVCLDPKTGELLLKGDSYPEDAARFFEPIISWVREYVGEAGQKILLHVDLNYINSSSTKCLLILFDLLEDTFNNGKEVEVFWHYDEENDVAQEIGEEFKEDYKLPFAFKPYTSEEPESEKKAI